MNYNDFIDTVAGTFPFVDDTMRRQFAALDGLYRDWNAKINVISRKDMDEFYLHHVIHSLAIGQRMYNMMKSTTIPRGSAPIVPRDRRSGRLPSVEAICHCEEQSDVAISILDLGTGGGFPGIPMAILFPEVQFTLCDSIGKKILVAGEVAKALGLENVTTICCRAEELREQFDYVMSRAVAPLDRLLEWAHGKYRRGMFCLKGGDIAEEIAAASRKCHLKQNLVHPWPIQQWVNDDYFLQKFVIFIENICN